MAQARTPTQPGPGPKIETLRSPLGRARGLGAAKHGAGVWWAERMTSLALLPLTLWFVWFALHVAGLPRATVAHTLAHAVNATLMLALVLVLFRHMQLGLLAVIEDYSRASLRSALIIAVNAATGLLALVCVVALASMLHGT
jgi:succinate dehydrogenase / fumarate reductase membrane anchor subunit